jgi:transcriptional regulator with PAS, ATPase and Fis domain
MSVSFDPEFTLPDWARELPAAITVCDKNAIILYMNDKSNSTFTNSGGSNLIGKSLYDCHSEYSSHIIRELLESGRSNIYTIEKNGTKKMICQFPWFKEGIIAGLVELSIVLPPIIPHFIRQ